MHILSGSDNILAVTKQINAEAFGRRPEEKIVLKSIVSSEAEIHRHCEEQYQCGS